MSGSFRRKGKEAELGISKLGPLSDVLPFTFVVLSLFLSLPFVFTSSVLSLSIPPSRFVTTRFVSCFTFSISEGFPTLLCRRNAVRLLERTLRSRWLVLRVPARPRARIDVRPLRKRIFDLSLFPTDLTSATLRLRWRITSYRFHHSASEHMNQS